MQLRPMAMAAFIMTLVGLIFLGEVRGRLSGVREQRVLAKFWKKRVAQEQLNKMVLIGKFADFKQEVALLIPEAHKKKKKENNEKQKLRDLASVIPHERLPISLGTSADRLMREGKEAVMKKEFKVGVKNLEQLIADYPDSHHNVEAYYLIAEAYAQLDKEEQVVRWAEAMIDIFPENRMTGFAMLKLGRIYERESRYEDALKVYKTILFVYDDPTLKARAEKSVKELEL